MCVTTVSKNQNQLKHPGLPPGILDNELELLWDFQAEKLKAIFGGHLVNFEELPPSVHSKLQEAMEKDQEAMNILTKLGPKSMQERLWLYCKCKSGGYNRLPDLTTNGVLATEHWDCGCNGNCILHPLFRNKLEVPNGHLTSREIEVLKLLVSGDCPPGKAVADHLGISENTLRNHKSNIFEKLGISSVQELAGWAHKIGML